MHRPFPNSRVFSLKNDFYWLLDFTNVRAQLLPHRQFSLYFLMNIDSTRLQQSVIFNLYSIATYNKHLFTIILIIHMLAFFTALLLATVNSSKTEVCAHITKLCGLKARNFIASVKYIVFLLLVTWSRSGQWIVRYCR